MLLALSALGLAISSVPLEIRGNYPILQDVFVNGKGPYRMLVDTGAQSTSLRPAAAQDADLRPAFAVELQRASGTVVAPAAQADRMASGELVLEGVEVLIVEPPQIASLGHLDGVLGQSFLSRTNYWMDYGRRSIWWDPEGALAGCLRGDQLEFVTEDGRPAVRTRLGGEERSFVLDTGASHLILFGPESTARVIRLGTMAVGGLRWRGLTAGVLPATGPASSGLLPGHLLKSFYINNRKQYVLVGPRVSGPCASVPSGPLARRGEATDKGW
ncbi:MAG: aspartyl protease family protein [Acidobacteriota bacterium]